MDWSAEMGFLPKEEPLTTLPIVDYRQTELIFTWENLAQIIPHYIKECCLREELIYALRKANCSYYHGFIDNLNCPRAYERLFLLLSYFAATYINSPEGCKKKKLPKELAIPFSRVAHLVSRKPVLDYKAFVLYNWRRRQPSSAIIGNVEPLITFTDTTEEKAFISALVEMEFLGGKCFSGSNPFTIYEKLKDINDSLSKCGSDFRYKIASVFFQDFDNLLYEGWVPNLQSYKFDFLGQSPFVARLRKYLDNVNKDGYGKESKRMQKECVGESEKLFYHLSFKD